MSAAPQLDKHAASAGYDRQAGTVALLILRITLGGCVLALMGTLVHIAWKALS